MRAVADAIIDYLVPSSYSDEQSRKVDTMAVESPTRDLLCAGVCSFPLGMVV